MFDGIKWKKTQLLQLVTSAEHVWIVQTVVARRQNALGKSLMTSDQAQQVWDLAYRFWPEGSVFRIFCRRPSGEVFGSAVLSPTELGHMTTWADANGYNSYWQINPTRKRHGTRVTTADITHWCFIPFDIDPIQPGANPHAFYWSLIQRLEDWVPGIDYVGSAMIDSGRGVQLLFPIPALFLDNVLRDRVPRTLSVLLRTISDAMGIQYGCILDSSCGDLPRIMRLPFTVNQKSGGMAGLQSTVYRVALASPHALLDAVPLPEHLPPKVESREHWLAFLPHLTAAARRFLTEGSSSGNRHHAATAALLSLLECGATEGQVRSALTVGAALSEPPLPYSEIDYMVNRRFRLTSGPTSVTLLPS